MTSVLCLSKFVQRQRSVSLVLGLVIGSIAFSWQRALAEKPCCGATEVADSKAVSQAEMKPYKDKIPNTRVEFGLAPIPGGTFTMGSPDSEKDRGDDEGPQFSVEVEPFWMGTHEVTWSEYESYMLCLDIKNRRYNKVEATPREKLADAVSRPTKPYTDMTFGMGKKGYPAICMTQMAARVYCKWLSEKTGRFYRLPTEAEWEYACRAGTTTAYSFGEDPSKIDDYAWHTNNSDDEYHKVGKKKPNPWGLYDIHGNVAEWVLDQHVEDHYKQLAGKRATVLTAFAAPKSLYPRVVRGGSWDDDVELLRSSARAGSNEDWKEQDPQFPKSIWYHTDALHVGFRIVRPLKEPSAEEQKAYWDAGLNLPKEMAAGKVGCNKE